MKNMNDVNEKRLTAAMVCGKLSARMANMNNDDAREYLRECIAGGAYIQMVRDAERWVTLRERIERLMQYHDLSSQSVAALRDVIDIMDELEEP